MKNLTLLIRLAGSLISYVPLAAALLSCSTVIRASPADFSQLDKPATVGKPGDASRWDKYLTGTYWYVPTDSLPAQFHRGSSVLPVEQQTVYYIDKSTRGVFTGWIVTQFTTAAAGMDLPISCQDMFGTIAPRGEIALTVVTPSTGVVAHPWPVSYMTAPMGRWLTMVLASTIVGDGSGFITHGPTYMTPITPRSPYWYDLPGSPGAVPEFVSQCGHSIEQPNQPKP